METNHENFDAPVEIHNVAYGDQKKDHYLTVNPTGRVPALRFDDGDALTRWIERTPLSLEDYPALKARRPCCRRRISSRP